RPDTVRLAVVQLLDVVGENAVGLVPKLRAAAQVAVQCVSQNCTLADFTDFLRSAGVTAKEASDWGPIAMRLLAIVQPRTDGDPGKLAAELSDILLDGAKIECAGDSNCLKMVTALRDISTGLVDTDYLRALGGVVSLLHVAGVWEAIQGKPLELA